LRILVSYFQSLTVTAKKFIYAQNPQIKYPLKLRLIISDSLGSQVSTLGLREIFTP